MNKKSLVEAALFVSDKALSIKKLSSMLNLSEQEVRKVVEELKREYVNRGVELVETKEGFEFRIRPEYRKPVAKLAPLSELSPGMLRTLAIVALKQPVKQSLIVRYQGNKVYTYLKFLERKGLVKTEKFGRTKIVYTTQDFEKYFGKSSEEIKRVLEKLS